MGEASTVPEVARHCRKTVITMTAPGRQEIFNQLLWLVPHAQLQPQIGWVQASIGVIRKCWQMPFVSIWILQALLLGSFLSIKN